MDHKKLTKTRIKCSKDAEWLQQLCQTLSAEILTLKLRLQGEEDTHSAVASLMRAALKRVGDLHAVATARLRSLNLKGSLSQLLASVPPTPRQDDLPRSLKQLAQQHVLSGSYIDPPSQQAEAVSHSCAKWRAANPEYMSPCIAANPEYAAEWRAANSKHINRAIYHSRPLFTASVR